MGTDPYELVYQFHDDPFVHNQILELVAATAKDVGVPGFKGLYKNYCRQMRRTHQTVFQDNVTRFTDQPLILDAGMWEANDLGVFKDGPWGEVIACPHPVLPVERLVNLDTGLEKLKLAYRKGERWRELIVDRATLASAQKVTALADRGLSVTSETAKAFVQYISDLENLNYDRLPERKSISRLGYLPGEGFVPYVDGILFDGEATFRPLFQAVHTQGDWEVWQETARACRRESMTARVMLAASFASPLVELLGALPFFVHLWGVDSGTGKTVALMLAASVWGDPAIGAYLKTFDATVVGHEKTAAFLNHLPLCLDELQLAKAGHGPAKFDVYKLAQGVGRTRGTKYGGVDQTPTWRNCILTTGESPLTTQNAGAGAINRVIEIECKAEQAVIADGVGVSSVLKQNFGWAGQKFIEELYGNPRIWDDVRALYRKNVQALLRKDTTEKQAMAAAVLMTADYLLCGWFFQDTLPLTPEDLEPFLASREAVSAGQRGYRYLCEWVAQNAVRFLRWPAENDARGVEVAGVLAGEEVFLIRSVFQRVTEEGGFSPQALLSWLKQTGRIRTRGRNRTVGKRINGVLTECVCMQLPRGREPVRTD